MRMIFICYMGKDNFQKSGLFLFMAIRGIQTNQNRRKIKMERSHFVHGAQ